MEFILIIGIVLIALALSADMRRNAREREAEIAREEQAEFDRLLNR